MLALLALLIVPTREIVVRPNGPIPTLAAAVAVARRGDTITIQRGTYRTGNVTVRVPGLTIRGEGYPVLDGGGQGHAWKGGMPTRGEAKQLRGSHRPAHWALSERGFPDTET